MVPMSCTLVTPRIRLIIPGRWQPGDRPGRLVHHRVGTGVGQRAGQRTLRGQGLPRHGRDRGAIRGPGRPRPGRARALERTGRRGDRHTGRHDDDHYPGDHPAPRAAAPGGSCCRSALWPEETVPLIVVVPLRWVMAACREPIMGGRLQGAARIACEFGVSPSHPAGPGHSPSLTPNSHASLTGCWG